LVFLISLKFAAACGWYFYTADLKYQLLDPEIIEQPDFTPYFLSEHLYYDWTYPDNSGLEENLMEWAAYWNFEIDTADIYEVVYTSTIEDLENMRDGKSILIPSFKGNALARHFLNGKSSDALDYLIFAKRCEPLAVIGNGGPQYYWGEPEEVDTRAMKTLILGANKGYKNTSDLFLRLRYAFQAIRMAHYAGEYNQCLRQYEELIEVPGLDQEIGGLIAQWCLSLKAGALYRIGENVASSFYFAQLFDACPSRRSAAYLSFSINSDEDWEACLAMANSPEEESNLWFLNGIDYHNHSLSAIQTMLELSPESENIEVLLMRHLAQAELLLLPDAYDYYSEGDAPGSGDFAEGLTKLLEEAPQQFQVAHPVLWKFGEGYMKYMNGNLSEARTAFASCLSDPSLNDFPGINPHVRTLSLLIDIGEMKKPDMQKLNTLTEELRWLEKLDNQYGQDAYQLAMEKIARLFFYENGEAHNGHSALALACKFDYADFRYQVHFQPLESIIDLMSKENEEPFESYIIGKAPHSLEDFYEMLGTVRMYNGDVEGAVEAYSFLDDDYQVYGYRHYVLDDDPFEFSDPGYSEHNPLETSVYTKKELAQTILDLESKVQSDKSNRYEHLMRLGTVWYNTTYWGNSWEAVCYWHSTSGVFPEEAHRADNIGRRMFTANAYMLPTLQSYNYERPQEYFQKALNATKDREEKARAMWMLSLCDQHQSGWAFSSTEPGNNSYYEELYADYGNTSFYHEVILDCAIFRNYWDMPPLERYR
jgi:hypothetical protein